MIIFRASNSPLRKRGVRAGGRGVVAFLLLGVFALTRSLSAEDFKLRQPEDYSAWQITHTYAKPKPKEMNGVPLPVFEPWGVKSATLTVTKPLWHEEDADTQGGKVEYWFDGKVTFYKTSGDPLPRMTAGNSEPQPVMGGKGFRGLEWANDKTFVSAQKLEGRQCLLFISGEMKLWADADTHYPVRWQKGGETRDYRQLPAPTQPVPMPADIQQESEAIQHDLELYKKPVPRLGRKKV